MLRRLGQQTLRKQNYRHLSCEYMRQVSSHVPSCPPLSLLAAARVRTAQVRAVPAQRNARYTDRCTISDQELGASFLPPGVLEVPDFSADRGTRCASSHRGASLPPLHASPASLCHTQSRWLADRENSVGRAASAPTHGAHLVGGPRQTSARNGCIAAHGRGAPLRCSARPSARRSEAAA